MERNTAGLDGAGLAVLRLDLLGRLSVSHISGWTHYDLMGHKPFGSFMDETYHLV